MIWCSAIHEILAAKKPDPNERRFSALRQGNSRDAPTKIYLLNFFFFFFRGETDSHLLLTRNLMHCERDTGTGNIL